MLQPSSGTVPDNFSKEEWNFRKGNQFSLHPYRASGTVLAHGFHVTACIVGKQGNNLFSSKKADCWLPILACSLPELDFKLVGKTILAQKQFGDFD